MTKKFVNLRPIPVCKPDRVAPIFLDREGIYRRLPQYKEYLSTAYDPHLPLVMVVCPKCLVGIFCQAATQFTAYKEALDNWALFNQ
jgi:hypothetical protein